MIEGSNEGSNEDSSENVDEVVDTEQDLDNNDSTDIEEIDENGND